MFRTALLCTALGLLALGSSPASAQQRGRDANPTVSCSSNDSRQRSCDTPFRGRAVLVENLSDTRCIEGRNWGSGPGRVWVDHGCRGRFAEAGGPGGWDGGDGRRVRCESTDHRQRVCDTGWREAVLVRQLSDTRCVEGRSWGQRDGRIWVDDGCRAEFAEGRGGGGGGWDPGPGNRDYSVTCSSDDNRHRDCAWDPRRGRPFVLKQLSDTRCDEGRTWGWRGDRLWVDDGCRARFGAR